MVVLLLGEVGSHEPPAPAPTRPAAGDGTGSSSFEEFFREAEALAWGFEHWTEVEVMGNPIGYLYRVGTSRSRPARRVLFEAPAAADGGPDVEPALARALGTLTANQREAVVLLAGYGCTFDEVARLTGRSMSTVNTHYRRGLAKLRAALGDGDDPR